ncbi:hypothetical protein BAY61_29120 [Prauserella marina]|uniref:Uncharacterized conserved protein YbbC, DUF1343 family n=1 Tax=Prauserella marina TaxID=530584 RepID=A0A222VWT0_9PSEU|nr:DUF1343 domain-containing protein [Prauserella marina]ASR38389.1 hypothetical protein BAY61_29120 [Prauserella marina]PWV78381.1 uncharacterized protein YbbC (DUF1343 family) [Prauserella marina]SDC84743.1 Uncharacterized conserved protein YbbC, DUF1343 family [Prauserella marina]
MAVNRRLFLAASALATPVLCTSSSFAVAEPMNQPGSVVPGADRLAAEGWRRLSGRKVGVLSNPTGVLANSDHIVDSLVAAGVTPVAAFGPEHGFRGSAQAGGSEGDYVDPRSGVPVYDAYRASADELAAMLTKAGVDTVVFDIADIGARFYTYIWSMYTAQLAAAKTGASFVVLDRPNPLGGDAFGPVLDPAFDSDVGLKPIAQQHGMTVGELARFFAAEFLPDEGVEPGELDVVEVAGWQRDSRFAETGLVWAAPSPNMPTPETALSYVGTGLFEGTELSEGRGTTQPFETIGAPGIDWRWREELATSGLGGVTFRETYFVPTSGKFAGQDCGGVTLAVTDPHAYDAIGTAVTMIVSAKRLYPGVFRWREDNFIDKLAGSDRLRRQVDAGAGTEEIVGAWQRELADFRTRREPYLRYR